MQSQVKKLAVICNVCFWLTIVFKYWKNARNIQPDVLNTILILGMAAIVANGVWLFLFLFNKKKTALVNEHPVFINLLLIFNILSLVLQIIYLFPTFLFSLD
jgi:hypothetical protein